MERLEFESIEKLKSHLQTSKDLRGAAFQSLDLGLAADELRGAVLEDNVLLGCTASEEVLALFTAPLVFPQLPGLPFNPFRSTLYSPEELLGAYQIGQPESYANTVDGESNEHYLSTGGSGAQDVVVTLARRLHDHAISDALHEYLHSRKVVSIMGGHSMARNDPMYLEVARLARSLCTAGFLPTSGGGPGAMEATHLGAWFAERPDEELTDAVSILSESPVYEAKDGWMDTAFRVVQKYPLTSRQACASLGIPTWLYGHEPPTCFATDIAKYFSNSVREEGLLAIAFYGVVFAPGSAGTIQEIFQDAAQNHYESFHHASPMLFFGSEYWTRTKPVYPLLNQLAEGHGYRDLIAISDDRHEILRQIRAFAASLPAKPGRWPPP